MNSTKRVYRSSRSGKVVGLVERRLSWEEMSERRCRRRIRSRNAEGGPRFVEGELLVASSSNSRAEGFVRCARCGTA